MKEFDFYGRGFDLPIYPKRPLFSYMVASVPRSGSTYFLRQLWARGVFGAPLEYLNPLMNHSIVKRLGAGNFDTYWESVQRLRTTSNGVFGFKMFIANYRTILEERPNFLKSLTPDAVIYYTRRDKEAQAVSYARAVATDRWFAQAKEKSEPKYNFATIYRMERSIHLQEASWEKVFILGDVKPFRVEYSILIQNEDGVMAQIASHFGLELDGSRLKPIEETEKQGDQLNHEWKARYLEEKSKRGLPNPRDLPEVGKILAEVEGRD